MFAIHNLFYQKKLVTREQAIVLDTRDPNNSGRIIAGCHTLGTTNWIPYVMSPGDFQPPKVGDVVYIECEEGHESYAIAHGKVTNLNKDLAELPGSLYRQVPTVSSWISNGPLFSTGLPIQTFGPNGFTGHAILLDDGQQLYNQAGTIGNESAGIKILSYNGAKVILWDVAGEQQILIADFNNTSTPLAINSSTGNLISIDSSSNTITIRDNSGNFIALGNSSIIVNGVNKSIQIESQSTININATGTVTVTGGTIVLDSPTNTINGGVVTSNSVNNDPITGIPLTPVGGITTGT